MLPPARWVWGIPERSRVGQRAGRFDREVEEALEDFETADFTS